MKNIKQIRESYNSTTNIENREKRNIDALVDAGLFEEKKLPVLKKILEQSPDKMSGSEKRFIVNLLESLIHQVVTSSEDLLEAKKDYLSKYDPRGPKNWPSDTELPPVIILKRKAIRVYPDQKKVALYYAQSIDRYVSIPYGEDLVMAVNEAVDDDKKKRPVPKKLPSIAKKTNFTSADLPDVKKYLYAQAVTSDKPLQDALINIGIYSGIKSRIKKAAAMKPKTEPSKPKETKKPSPFAGAAEGVWKQRRLEESFQDRLESLREQARARVLNRSPSIPLDGVADNISDLVKKYGPKVGKAIKTYGPIALRSTPAGRVAGAFLDMVSAAGKDSDKPQGKPSAAALETPSVVAARKKAASERQATFDALKDATKQSGQTDAFSYSKSKEAKNTVARNAAAALNFPGAGTIGLGDIRPVRITKKVDVDRVKDIVSASKAKGRGADLYSDANRAASKRTAEKIKVPAARNDVNLPSIEKELERQEKAKKATAQTQAISSAQAGEKAQSKEVAKTTDQAGTRVRDREETQADKKARSRNRLRSRNRNRFRMPEIPIPSSQPGAKEPGPNYQFGLKPTTSVPQPVSNRAAVDRWMDIINRKANQAMLKENPERKDDEDEVGTATTVNDKPVYNFRRRPKVGVSKAASASSAVERWMERISRQANQAMLNQQNESVYNTIQNMVENNINEDVISFGKENITINNTVAKKLVSLHESMNKKNKKKMEEMLNESASSFQKILTFAVRH